MSCTRDLGISKRSIPPAAPEEPVFKTGESGGKSSDESLLGEADGGEGAAEAKAEEERPPPRHRNTEAAADAGDDARAAATAGGVAP